MNISFLTVVRSFRYSYFSICHGQIGDPITEKDWVVHSKKIERILPTASSGPWATHPQADPFSTLKFTILGWKTKISIIWYNPLLTFWLGHRILSSSSMLKFYFQLNIGFVSVYSTLSFSSDNSTYRSHYHFTSLTTINIFISLPGNFTLLKFRI